LLPIFDQKIKKKNKSKKQKDIQEQA
jgi:hypothetical protein